MNSFVQHDISEPPQPPPPHPTPPREHMIDIYFAMYRHLAASKPALHHNSVGMQMSRVQQQQTIKNPPNEEKCAIPRIFTLP